MGIDPRGLAQAMGDAEARLNAVREECDAQRAKAAGLDAIVTYQRERIRELETENASLKIQVEQWRGAYYDPRPRVPQSSGNCEP